MAENKTNNEKIVIVYKQRKIQSNFKNDEFFEYVNLSMKKHFGKNQEILIARIEEIKELSGVEKNELFRNTLIMSVANEGGYIGIDWEKYFGQKPKDMLKTSRAIVSHIKSHLPFIIEDWDKAVNKAQKEKESAKQL